MPRDVPGITSTTLWALTEQTEQGLYVLPTIQREFIWKDQHIKDFVIAMKKRFPLGIITLWSPPSTFVVDPVPFMDGQNPLPTASYVLDGQQRITTMLLIRNDFSIKRGGETIERRHVFYDPFNDEIVLRAEAQYPDNEISLTDLAHQNKEYREWVDDLESQNSEREKARIEDFARALRENPVGMHIVGPSYSYQDVASIFLTINSAGVTVKPIDMFFSLLATDFTKAFKDDILKFHRSTTKKTNLSIRTPIRCLAAAMDLKQSNFTARRMKRSIDHLTENKERTMAEWFRVKEALAESYRILSDRGFENLRILPAEAVLTPFAFYIYSKGRRVSGRNASLMFYWLLMASYHDRYSQSVNSRLDQDLDSIKAGKDAKKLVSILRRQVGGLKVRYEDFFDTYSKKMLLLMFATERNRNAMDWFGAGLVRSNDMHVHHIFPKKYLTKNGITDPMLMDDVCNTTLVSSEANLDILSKAPVTYFRTESVDTRKLEQHFVPLDDSLWTADAYEDFLEHRRNLLSCGVDAFLKSLT